MKVNFEDVTCSGYPDHNIDFPALVGTLSEEDHKLLETMIEGAVTAESDPAAGRFCVITVVGHSDRVDTAGVSREQARADELQTSELRAESAQSWFFEQLFERLKAEGRTAPVDIGSLQNVDLRVIACGAAELAKPNPGPNDRPLNRRVHFTGTMFTPGNTP